MSIKKLPNRGLILVFHAIKHTIRTKIYWYLGNLVLLKDPTKQNTQVEDKKRILLGNITHENKDYTS
jgi:hypothetical protein